MRVFQSKWLLFNPIIVTFLADSVPFKEKCISPNVQTQMPRNLVEMCLTKSSNICKNLGFIWLLDCYQILILPPLLHADNCCTIADKIHSKTEASLIQFSWNLYRILYHKSRACMPNFKPIQIDWITQTQTWSQLAHFFNYWTDFNQLSYNSSIWIKLKINLFEYFHKTYIHSIYLLKVILLIYPFKPTQIWLLSIYPFKHLIASNKCIYIQFNQLICTQMNEIN